MNFKQSILLIYVFGFFLETFYMKHVIAFNSGEDKIRKEKGNKKYMRNEYLKKQKGNTKSQGINDSDLEEIIKTEALNKSTHSLFEGDRDNLVSAFSEMSTLLNDAKKENTLSRKVEQINSEHKNSKVNDHSGHYKITGNIETYPVKNTEKHNEELTSLWDHDTKTSEKQNKTQKGSSSNYVSSGTTLNKIEEPNKNDANTNTIAESLIDQLSDLLVADLNKYNNEEEEEEEGTNRKTQRNTNSFPGTANRTNIHSSKCGENVNDITNSEDSSSYEIDDIEPRIEKTIYYPLGGDTMERFFQKIRETIKTNEENANNANESQVNVNTKNSEESKFRNSLNAKPKSGNYENATKTKNHVSFLQKDSQEMKKRILNEDDNSDNDINEEEDASTEEIVEEESMNNIIEEKIKEDTNLASFDMEEDTDENNKNNKDDSSTRIEKKLIRNARKVYKLNLFNCNYINNWDFSKDYVDEQGTLVKLSGYVFQNMLNSNSMPTKNITEWKLKGACDYDKYICGALQYFNNVYQKGDRIIFEGEIYEALNDTIKSPKDDDGTWIGKTSECFDL